MCPRALIAAVALAASGCNRDNVDIRSEDPDRPADYGLGQVLAGVQEMAGVKDSAEAYRRFYHTVENLRPGFSESVAAVAELHQVFLAVGPLDAAFDLPPEAQLDLLATTVWPVALEARPHPDEAPRAYLERVCGAELALECKYVVPEYWGVVLGHLVWRELEERGRDAYRGCPACKADPAYQEALDLMHRRVEATRDRLAQLGDDVHPKSWPAADQHARPWIERRLLIRAAGGGLHLDGKPPGSGRLRATLAAGHGGETALGLYIRPDAEVGSLRAIAEEAAAAGYQELAIQARGPEYPWPMRAYHLVIGRPPPGTPALVVRDVDTIQMLVQAMEVSLARNPDSPALSARAAGRPR